MNPLPKNYNPIPPLGSGAAIGLAAALVTNCAAPPEIMDTHTGEWEPAPGWQCDGQPCTDEQLQHLIDTLEVYDQ